MKPWIALTTRLYPAAWRERYGNEFQALLEDVNPGWRELFDVLGGAIKMQLTNGATYWKLAAAFALAGMLIATVASFVIPKDYHSTAVLRMQNTDGLAEAERKVLSRTSLAQIINDPALNLYPADRASKPLEDVVEYMRMRAIHINVIHTKDGANAIQLSFRYPDKNKAQAVVRRLIARLAESFAGEHVRQNLEISDPPSLPKFADSPKRPEMLIEGATAGLLLGVIAAFFVRQPRRALVLTITGLVGSMLGASLSLVVPNRYISTATIRVDNYDKTLQDAAARMQKDGLHFNVLHPAGQSATVLQIQFTGTDPRKAEAMVESAATNLILESHIHQSKVEFLDGPSYPESPVAPNWYLISFIGLLSGVTVGIVSLLIQNRRAPKLA
jgi:LPS O-antigen subunit length determinant protein (WzzB/FepE family)